MIGFDRNRRRRAVALLMTGALGTASLWALTAGGSATAATAAMASFSGIPQSDAAKLSATLQPAQPGDPATAVVDAQVRERASLGLPSDRNYVIDLLAGRSSSPAMTSNAQDFYGLVLTGDEAAQVADRNYLQSSMSNAGGVNQKAMDTYSSFVETHLGITNGQAAATMYFDGAVPPGFSAWLDGVVPASLRPIVHAESIPAPRAELDALAAKVSELNRTEKLTLSLLVNYSEGTVHIQSASQADLDRAATQFSGKLVRFDLTGKTGPTVNKDDVLPYGLMESSLYVIGSSYEHPGGIDACTSGFSVSSAYGPMLLTAGHCFTLNSMMYAPNFASQVGSIAARNYADLAGMNSTFDAEIASTYSTGRPLWGRVHINAADWGHQITGTIGQNTDSLGDFSCQSGWASGGMNGYSGPTCGAILTRNFLPWYIYYGTAVYRLMNCTSTPGDSGGGVYWGTIYGDLAVGLVHGYTTAWDGSYDAIISHLPYVTNTWGLTVMTN
jgi:hypothetical protein